MTEYGAKSWGEKVTHVDVSSAWVVSAGFVSPRWCQVRGQPFLASSQGAWDLILWAWLLILFWHLLVTSRYVYVGLAAYRSKANRQARLVERNACFISDTSNWGEGEGGRHLFKGWLPPSLLPTSRGWEPYRQSWGWSVTCRSNTVILTVIFKLVISDLPSIILIVLGTVNLQFQSPFVPISLWSVLGIVAVYNLVIM